MALLLGFSSPEYPCARGPVMWWWLLVSWHCHESHVSWELFVTTIVTSVTQKMRQLIVVSRIGVNLLHYAQWWRASLNYNSNIIRSYKNKYYFCPGSGGGGGWRCIFSALSRHRDLLFPCMAHQARLQSPVVGGAGPAETKGDGEDDSRARSLSLFKCLNSLYDQFWIS